MIAPSSSNAEEIQRQMQSVRSSLREDVKELVENARDMTDWHYYVRRYPWAAVAAAAGVGFVVTPAMLGRRTPPSADTTNGSAAPNVAAQIFDERPSIVSRLAGSAFSAASGALSRAAMAFISHQLSTLLAGEPASRSPEMNHGDQQHVEPHF